MPNLVTWVLGCPLYFYYRLWKNAHLIKFKDIMEYCGFFYNGLKETHYHWYFFLEIFIIIYRFFITTALKFLLVLFNKTLLFHNMLYKALFLNGLLIVFKELLIKFRPFENEHFNVLSIICANVCVRLFLSN